jgi:uncharacterized protein YraI
MKRMLWAIVATLSMMVPAASFAADGYLITDVNMFAGPDSSYPVVQYLPANSWISVQGCTTGWEWCDVVAGPDRGWVAGTYISYMYNNQPVYVTDYGAQIGIPIVSFVIGSYWSRYYLHRSFYRDRSRWYGRPIPIRPPARPPMRPRPPIRPPGGGRPQPPGHGNRPQPPGGGHRPQPPRPQPPGNGNRPQPPGGGRPQPPGNGNRPQPPGGDGGNRPQPPGGNRPGQPGGGGNRPQPPGGNRPQPPNNGNRPAPRPNNPQQGNNGNQ